MLDIWIDRQTDRCKACYHPIHKWTIWHKEVIILRCISQIKAKDKSLEIYPWALLRFLPSQHSAHLFYRCIHLRYSIWSEVLRLDSGFETAMNKWYQWEVRPGQSTACPQWYCVLLRWPFSTHSGSRWSGIEGEWHLGKNGDKRP